MAGMMEGKVVVVTGAGGGIGREIAIMMAAAGARVIINDVGASLTGSGALRDARAANAGDHPPGRRRGGDQHRLRRRLGFGAARSSRRRSIISAASTRW